MQAGECESRWTASVRQVLSVIVAVGVGAAGIVGCDDVDSGESDSPEVFHVADVAVETTGEDEPWASDDDRVDGWFSQALEESDRGLSADEGDVRMRVRLRHRTRLQESRNDNRLAVHVRARAVRNRVGNGDPMVTLEAEAAEARMLSEKHPSVLRLHHEHRQIGEAAVERVVDRLRLQARLEAGGTNRLIDWIGDADAETTKRTTAIEWATRRDLVGPRLEEALVDASKADDGEVVAAACRALVELEVDDVAHLVVDRAQQLSRDDEYDAFVELLPLLGELDEQWISIYLQTVARAHEVARVRHEARSALDDPLPDVRF